MSTFYFWKTSIQTFVVIDWREFILEDDIEWVYITVEVEWTSDQVLDASSDSNIFFDRYGGQEVAYIIENDVIVAALGEKVRQANNVVVRNGVNITSYR